METRDKNAVFKFAVTVLALGWVLAWAGTTQAQLVTDNFNRANSPTIGTGWTELNNTNWSINANTVVMSAYEPANSPAILAYTGLTLPTQYTIAADVNLDSAGYLNGPAFHIQDATNYYTLRFQANGDTTGFYQLLKYVDGTPGVLASSASVPGINPLVWYRATVTVTNAGAFVFSIANGPTTLLSGSVIDGSPFAGGYGGLYSASIAGNFDNFEIVPEPGASALFLLGLSAIWAKARRKIGTR